MSCSENNNTNDTKVVQDNDEQDVNHKHFAIVSSSLMTDHDILKTENVSNFCDKTSTQLDTGGMMEENLTLESRLISDENDGIKEDSFTYSRECNTQMPENTLTTSVTKNDNETVNETETETFNKSISSELLRRCNLPRNISPINENDAVSASNTSTIKKVVDTITPSVLPRRVSFPKSDSALVTGYLEPANPWEQAYIVKNGSEVTDLYKQSCLRHNTQPLQTILDHLKSIEFSQPVRHPILSLKSNPLASSDCEAMEEIFKRIQYKMIDLSSCELEENAASALFDMFEYYEAANELDISYNAKGMTQRGWSSCTYMVSHSQSLHVLIAHGNPISKANADVLGTALSASHVHTLKLEHCGLKGQPLKGLCHQLRTNKILRELWLAYNDLDYLDADTIAELLKVNHYIELIDINNNNIKDEGVRLIVQALIIQAIELERRSTFHRSAAIDGDNENEVSIDQDTDLLINDIDNSAGADLINLQQKENSPELSTDLKSNIEIKAILDPTILTNTTCQRKEECMECNDNFESTMRTHSTAKNSTQMTGQSMLDKFLSMGSNSSSDDGTLSLSTQNQTETCCNNINIVDSKDILNTHNKNISTAELSHFDSVITNTATENVVSSGHNECTTTVTPKNANHIDNILEEFVTEAITSDNKCNSRNSNNNESDLENSACGINNNSNVNQQSDHNFHEKMPIEFEKNIIENTGVFEIMTGDQNEFMLTDAPVPQNSLFSKNSTKAVDVNKNTKVIIEDYDDTHSTDSAFESASEGDISRHLSDEFNRISTLFESTHIDDLINKQMPIETAIIATENADCLLDTDITPTSTPVLHETPIMNEIKSLPIACLSNTIDNKNKNYTSIAECPSNVSDNSNSTSTTKVTIDTKSLVNSSDKEIQHSNNIITTPPPPSISPGCAGASIKRMDSNCAFITQSTRTRSQSSDSLCSDNSLDNSITSDYNFSTSTKLNEKLTKNDTLTRQQRQPDASNEIVIQAPSGLKALSLWSNNLTKDSGYHIASLLNAPISLELLNIGKNCLSNDFLLLIKESLMKNASLTTLGCQSAHLSAKGIDTLASILTFGGNSTLQRIDIRDNKLEVESLSTLADVLQSNTTIMQIDIDDEPKRLSVDSEAYVDYRRILENVRAKCSRNEKSQSKLHADKLTNSDNSGRQHGAYNVGSRKISLTCHSRPLIDTCNSKVIVKAMPTPAAKLEIKRKTGTRLRSPVPSPPTISPSSSPNRSRFHVVRVQEISPLTSPQMQTPPPSVLSCSLPINVTNINQMTQCASATTKTTAIPHANVLYEYKGSSGSSFPPTNTIPVMTSSTQSIKRISTSPRSRFHVSKIYEDPKVPLLNRSLPPITPHINVLSPPPIVPVPVTVTENVNVTLADSAEININVPATRIETKDANFTSITNTKTNALHQNTSTKTDAESTTTTTTTTCPPSTINCPSSFKPLLSPILSPTITSPVTESNPPTSLSHPPPNATSLTESTSDCLDCPREDTSTGDTGDAGDAITSTDTITPNSPAMSIMSEVIAKATTVNTNTPLGSNASSQNRTRKSSWMGAPHTVDKFLTIFQNFQRSSSPEQSPASHATSVPSSSNPIDGETALVPTSRSSPLSWSRYGPEILHNSGGGNVDGSTLEQPFSLLDVAKQLRDLSKQVFRSNPYSLNENNSIGMCCTSKQSTSISEATTNRSDRACDSGGGGGGGGDNDGGNVNLCTDNEVPHIPKSVKREIKENISPEHTINEETLYSLQKLCTYGNTTNPKDDCCLDSRTSGSAADAAADVELNNPNPAVTTATVLDELKTESTANERDMAIASTSQEP